MLAVGFLAVGTGLLLMTSGIKGTDPFDILRGTSRKPKGPTSGDLNHDGDQSDVGEGKAGGSSGSW